MPKMSETLESQKVGTGAAPAHYGDAAAEYEAVRGGGAGLFDLSARGRIEVSGAEAVQFLNGLVTNDVKALEDGAWMSAAFPNVQGRLLARARVVRAGGAYLFDTEEATSAAVLKNLERFTLAGDFRVRDLTRETATLSVQGAGAGRVVAGVFGDGAARVERGRTHLAEFQKQGVTIIRATHTAEDGFDLFAGAGEAGALWDALAGAGARPAGRETLEVLRVEAGLPRYGVDMTEANVVLEVAEEDAVSFTKGCYVGQEIIARIHWRGHVAKKLTGLLLDLETGAGASRGGVARAGQWRVKSADGREVGRVTSVVFSPRLEREVALAVVKYDYLAPGTEVRIFAGDEERGAARVAALPLVRGSWYESGAVESGGAAGTGDAASTGGAVAPDEDAPAPRAEPNA